MRLAFQGRFFATRTKETTLRGIDSDTTTTSSVSPDSCRKNSISSAGHERKGLEKKDEGGPIGLFFDFLLSKVEERSSLRRSMSFSRPDKAKPCSDQSRPILSDDSLDSTRDSKLQESFVMGRNINLLAHFDSFIQKVKTRKFR